MGLLVFNRFATSPTTKMEKGVVGKVISGMHHPNHLNKKDKKNTSDMKDELVRDLKEVYAAKWLSEELEGNEDNFDFPLLTILIKGVDEPDSLAEKALQVRARTEYNEEQLVLVLNGVGHNKPLSDDAFNEAAEIIEKVTESLMMKFPDDVLLYKWDD